ncbi:MAG: Smr/MutS family protein [Novosphingobium sp.]
MSAGEAALWRRVAETVTPLAGRRRSEPAAVPRLPVAGEVEARPPAALSPQLPPAPPRRPARDLTAHGLDASWERKLARAELAPDMTIDLHGHGLDAAYDQLMRALAQATARQARLVLVIAGLPRPHGEHDRRGQRRGAIRAKLLDWLAASPHAGRIAAVRPAHPRHGGAGAVYVVLRRAR